MKLRILFNGFRHSHIHGLYKKVMAAAFAEVASCLEPDDEARAAAETALGAVFSRKSYAQWLEDPEVNVVAIGNAYGHRGDAVIAALQAGKHVLADKPICTDGAQLARIRALAEEKRLLVGCMLDLRYLPQTVKAKELLDSGRLGAVRNVAFNGQHCLDYGKRPGWYFEPGMHGGTINDLAIHGIDLVRMLTGQNIAAVDAARVWNAYAQEQPHFLDSALFMARLENGAGVLADVSYSAPKVSYTLPSYWEFRFWCEKGMLSFSYADSGVMLYEQGQTTPLRIETQPTDWDYLQEFLASLETGSFGMTENTLCSTEAALMLQQAADREARL